MRGGRFFYFYRGLLKPTSPHVYTREQFLKQGGVRGGDAFCSQLTSYQIFAIFSYMQKSLQKWIVWTT